jgi:hypothetical protein
MNYADLIKTIKPQLLAAIAIINNPEIAPEVRQLNQEILLREVGKSVYDKIYEMNAFDFEIEHTKGTGIDERYYGLAKVASNSISTGGKGLDEYVDNYLVSMASKAQHDSVKNARQSNKHPTVRRTESGDACKWCRSMAGTHTNPSSDVFKRHGGCEGKIVTEGFRTRNGELSNYKRGEKVTVYRGVGSGTNVQGTDLFGSAHYVARDQSTAAQFGKVKAETLTISPKQIYTIRSDAQYEALVRDAQREYMGMDVQKAIPKLLQKRGFKAVEGTPGFDPLAGIAVFDEKLISK